MADSIKGGVDLVNDVRFKKYVLHVALGVPFFSHSHREDVITLQNPHGLPSASVSTAKASATQKDKVVAPAKPAAAGPVSAAATQKEAGPCPFHHLSYCSLLITLTQGTYLHTRLGRLALH